MKQKTLALLLSVIIVLSCLPLTGFAQTSTQAEFSDSTESSISAEETVRTELPITPELTDVYILEEPEPTSIYNTEDMVIDGIAGNGGTVNTMSASASSNTALTVSLFAAPSSEDTYIYYSNSSTVYGSSTEL